MMLLRFDYSFTVVMFFYSDVDMYQEGNAIMVKVNGLVLPIHNLAYQHPTGLLHSNLTALLNYFVSR